MSTVVEKTKAELVEELLATDEGKKLSADEIAEQIGANVNHVHRVIKQIRERPVRPQMVPLANLVLDYGTQMRPNTNKSREEEFEELYRSGVQVDPIEVYDTPVGLLPTDGWHRYAGRVRAGLSDINAIVVKGTEAEAIEAAARANAKGSLPRCLKTKENSVLALIDLYNNGLSERLLADKACVSRRFAAKVQDAWLRRRPKPSEQSGSQSEDPDKRLGRDGKMYATTRKQDSVGTRVPTEQDGSEFYDDDDDEPTESNRVAHTNGHVPPAAKEPSQAEKDEQWLSELGTGEGKTPVRPRLTEENRPVFDADALAYKKLHIDTQAFATFAGQANTAIKAKKVGGGKGNYALATSRYLRLKHPKDWRICYECKGKGCNAQGCHNLGYVVE